MEFEEHKGWYTRKGLPHLDAGELVQFITLRLEDSLPQSVLSALNAEFDSRPEDTSREKYDRIATYLDQGLGSCILREDHCAEIVQSSLLYLHKKKFDLRAWVVMPNHIHFLARFDLGQSLPSAMYSLKSFTTNQIRKAHPNMARVWQENYFDRYIRDDPHYWRTVTYIHENPVKAGLCSLAHEFRWSSASRFL